MFKKYRRTRTTEMMEITPQVLAQFIAKEWTTLSISHQDSLNGSPRLGDYIARNPDNHEDIWLVAKKYVEENYELVTSKGDTNG